MKLEKIRKALDKDTLAELDAMDEAGLNSQVVQSEESIATAVRERDANEKYKGAKLVLSDLNKALGAVRKRQSAKIAYALRRLRELGGEDLGDQE